MALEDFLPCAVLIPSLGRPHRLKGVIENIEESTSPAHRIIFCVGGLQSRKELEDAGIGRMGDSYRPDFGWYEDDTDDDDKRYVTRMNRLVSLVVDPRLDLGIRTVFFGSDDVVHHPGWLEAAIGVMEKEQKACVVVNDLRNPNGTQALMLVDYLPYACFDDEKSAFYHGYQHNYADTEMFATAMKYDQHTRAMESRVEHLHPIYQNNLSRPWDDTYRNAFANWNEDAGRFTKRMDALSGEPTDVVERKEKGIVRMWRRYG